MSSAREQHIKEGINSKFISRYRSSFSGTVATVFGATGMVGRGVTSRMGKMGTQMVIPYKGDFYDSQRLKVCGDLGQILFTPFHLKDEESIRKAMKYSDVVVNCIGREYETRNFKFKDVNVTGPATLARIAREMGVKRFIHLSSINASDKPAVISAYLHNQTTRTCKNVIIFFLILVDIYAWWFQLVENQKRR